jgi:hypothetical protein
VRSGLVRTAGPNTAQPGHGPPRPSRGSFTVIVRFSDAREARRRSLALRIRVRLSSGRPSAVLYTRAADRDPVGYRCRAVRNTTRPGRTASSSCRP